MAAILRVAGLDIASMNSGFVILETSTREGRPPFSYEVLHQEAIRNDPGFSGRVRASKAIVEKILSVGVDVVGIEDCVPIGGSTTSIQQSAFLAMVMFQLYEAEVPMTLISPATMRSFIQASTGKQSKASIQKNIDERYGFRAQHPRQKERSDITDAFCHAVICAMTLFAREGKLTSDLLVPEKRVIYGDKKMIGVLNRDVFLKKGTN